MVYITGALSLARHEDNHFISRYKATTMTVRSCMRPTRFAASQPLPHEYQGMLIVKSTMYVTVLAICAEHIFCNCMSLLLAFIMKAIIIIYTLFM